MTDTTAGAGEREACKNPVREALIAALRKAADEIAKAGHYGWGNVCADAAEYLAAQPAPQDSESALADRLAAALEPFVAHNSSDYTIEIMVRTADITQARAALAAHREARSKA